MNIILKQFRTKIIESFDEILKDYGFIVESKKMENDSCNVIFSNGKLYIRISATTNPRDYPFNSFNIVLGEGSLEFPESDWNSTSLWRIKNFIQKDSIESEYSLKNLDNEIKKAKNDLLEYGLEFLKLNLDLFNAVRKLQNQQREPYKIHLPNKDGKYIQKVESVSSKLKKKYS
jgi:hypothetical protein